MMVAVTLLAINQGNSQAEITLASLVPIIKQFYYLWKSLSPPLIELDYIFAPLYFHRLHMLRYLMILTFLPGVLSFKRCFLV